MWVHLMIDALMELFYLLILLSGKVVKSRYLVGRHFTEIESSSADINRIPKNNRDKRHVQT